MFFDFLSNLLYPKDPAWLRRKKVKTFLSVVLVAVVLAAIMAGLMLYAAYRERIP